MKKIFAMLLALVMVLSMVACQPSNAPTTPTDSSKPADNSSTPADLGTTGGGNSMAVCLASEPDTIDPALNSAVDGATLLAHLFSGLAKWSQDANGALMIAPDAAEELVEGVINDDGTVSYTYTLREGLKWSDGKDVTASDFVFAWKRAASEELGADYGYMFEVVKGYPNDLAISAPDDRTFEVTLTNTVAYWDELLAFPTFFPFDRNYVKEAFESNYSSAIETLKKYYTFDEATQKFTDFPTLTYLYNTSEAHKAIAEYLQSVLATVGITMNLENQEWNTFLNTRKNGDYSIARNGWVADYNDPICFLDMWISNSGNNDVQFGRGDNENIAIYSMDLTPYGYDTKVENGTWAQTYDVLISAIKTCTDNEIRYL